ncbi:MAG: O-antigen ligase family protein, partial [Planctomycetaceae bacterium]
GLPSGDVVRVLSAARFVKPILYVWIGSWLATAASPGEMLRRIGWSFAGTALVWGVSTVGGTDFPETAWGCHWLGLPVLGFPNTAMTFAAAMLPLLLAVTESAGRRFSRSVAALAVAVAFVLVVCSLSRCAAVVMVSGVTVYFLLTGGRWAPIGLASVAVLSVGTGYSLLVLQSEAIGERHPTLQERAAHRFVHPVNPDSGALAGRSAIWNETWELIASRPLWGYRFDPYSRRAAFDTPHQQYLEVLYKTGFAGLAMYAGLLGIGLVGLTRLGGIVGDLGVSDCAGIHAGVVRPAGWGASAGRLRGLRRFLRPDQPIGDAQRLMAATCGLLCGVLIGNLSQANLTFSLTGNFVFLLLGLVVHPRFVEFLAADKSSAEGVISEKQDASAGRRAA